MVCTYFAGMFAFGFGIAVLVPLSLAMSEPPERPGWFSFCCRLADLVIIIALKSLPVFWILLLGMKITRKWPEALAKWREDAVVRRHFRVFITSLTLALGFGIWGI